jgi:hypothetical protein
MNLMPRHLSIVLWITLVPAALMLTACGAGIEVEGSPVNTPAPFTDPASLLDSPDGVPTPLPGNLDTVTFVEDGKEYTISQLLSRDAIRPVYDPEFTSNPDAYEDDELVMGVAINGDARAYPVGYLRTREMVNDVVGGTPVLVTY